MNSYRSGRDQSSVRKERLNLGHTTVELSVNNLVDVSIYVLIEFLQGHSINLGLRLSLHMFIIETCRPLEVLLYVVVKLFRSESVAEARTPTAKWYHNTGGKFKPHLTVVGHTKAGTTIILIAVLSIIVYRAGITTSTHGNHSKNCRDGQDRLLHIFAYLSGLLVQP